MGENEGDCEEGGTFMPRPLNVNFVKEVILPLRGFVVAALESS